MIRISNREIIDVVKYDDKKAIIVEKKPLGELGKYNVNYFVLNFANGDKEGITKNAYLLKKFGTSFELISDTIANIVQCDATIFPNKNVLVVFPNGQAGMFNSYGEIIWNNELSYNNSPCSSIALDGNHFWTCCKDENCVIRYAADSIKLDLRIGSKDSNTFYKPCFASADDEFVYICCEDGRVRKIDKSNFTISDIKNNYTGLKKYYKYGRFSIICTHEGAFIDKDN